MSVASGVSEADTMDVDLSEHPVGAPAGAFSELPQVRLPPPRCATLAEFHIAVHEGALYSSQHGIFAEGFQNPPQGFVC